MLNDPRKQFRGAIKGYLQGVRKRTFTGAIDIVNVTPQHFSSVTHDGSGTCETCQTCETCVQTLSPSDDRTFGR